MSNPTELLPGTSIAATSWTTGDSVHLRVYTQDIEGGIRETRWNNGWSGGSSEDVITKAKPYSPIAVFNYNGGDSIRVYYITTENYIEEICQDNGGQWFAGELNRSKFTTSPVSRLTVIGETWDDHHISIYYQRPDGFIGEVRQDNPGWVEGGTIADKPLLGTGLAALTFETATGAGIRVYYQLPDGTLAEAGIDKGNDWFKQGGLPKFDRAAPATNISVHSHGNPQNPMFQVYFLGKRNTPSEWGYYSGAWHGENHPGHTTSSPSSGIAIVPVRNADNLRLYIQDESNRIQELTWAKGDLDWKKGSLIPVGNLQ